MVDLGPITAILETTVLGFSLGQILFAITILAFFAYIIEQWQKGRPPKWARKIPLGLLGIVIIAAVLYLGSPSVQAWLPIGKWLAVNPPAPPQQTQQQTTTQISRTFNLNFQAVDTLKGGVISSGSVYVYDQNLNPMETVTISNGAGSTALKYTSGTPLVIKWVSGNFVYEKQITVPYAKAETDTSFDPITLTPFTGAPTVAISMQDPAGNSLSSGGTYNVTAAGKTKGTLTVFVRITTDNTGFYTFNDYLKQVNGQPIDRTALLQLYASGTNFPYLILSGIPQAYAPSQTAAYYLQDLGPNFVRQVDSQGNVITPGVFTFTINYDASSLPHGSTVSLSFTVYISGSKAWFNAYHIQPSDAVSVATFTLTIAA